MLDLADYIISRRMLVINARMERIANGRSLRWYNLIGRMVGLREVRAYYA